MLKLKGNPSTAVSLFAFLINISARMESTGVADTIQISEATFNILSKTNEYIIEERGFVDVKGKGPMKTYFLVDFAPNNKFVTPSFRREILSNVTNLLSETRDYTVQMRKRTLSIIER